MPAVTVMASEAVAGSVPSETSSPTAQDIPAAAVSSAAACGVARPRASSRWAVWSVPPCTSGRPARRRATTTVPVSTAATKVSSSSAAAPTGQWAARADPGAPTTRTADAEIMNPMKSDPASPMKMRAGGQLWTRNPAQPPDRARSSSPMLARPVPKASAARAALVTMAMPAAAPSVLSSRLNELVIATIQASVTAAPSQWPTPGR
ncbi:MAG TPA: hypothetical protein VIX86_01605 [Streptosporangiaceae bacterium]